MNSKYSYGAVNLLFKLPFYLTCGDTWSPRALPVNMAVLTEMKLRRKISKRLEIKNKTKQTEKKKNLSENPEEILGRWTSPVCHGTF